MKGLAPDQNVRMNVEALNRAVMVIRRRRDEEQT